MGRLVRRYIRAYKATVLGGGLVLTGALTMTGDIALTGALTQSGGTISLTGVCGITGATTVTGNFYVVGGAYIEYSGTVYWSLVPGSGGELVITPSGAYKATVKIDTARTGTGKLDGVYIDWASATTYGSGGDRWGGSGSMEAAMAIGDDQAGCPITGPGTHLGEYINLSQDIAMTNAQDLCGGLFAVVTSSVAQTMGKISGVTSYIRNPSTKAAGANERFDAMRALIYTGATGETQHQVGLLVGILDMTTTKTAAQDVVGAWIQLNVANAAAGGNEYGIVFDNVGAVAADACMKVQGSGNWTYLAQLDDDGTPAQSTGSLSVQAGWIKVLVGAAVRYIPLYSS